MLHVIEAFIYLLFFFYVTTRTFLFPLIRFYRIKQYLMAVGSLFFFF